jgi:hypothetical protein
MNVVVDLTDEKGSKLFNRLLVACTRINIITLLELTG